MIDPLAPDVTEPVAPISDEMLADIAERGPKPVEWCIPITKAERDALLARLDAAEAPPSTAHENAERLSALREKYADHPEVIWLDSERRHWEAHCSFYRDALREAKVERDAALARALPEGVVEIDGKRWRVVPGGFGFDNGDQTARLVPADTEKP